MAVELVTIERVPILTTGTYSLSTGEFTFTEEDLKAAALAPTIDKSVKLPRIKLGHTDPRFEAAAQAAGVDGQPALGRCENLTVSDDGQTLYADLVVPDWLAAVMDWAYPARSIEGPVPGAFTSAMGQTHEFVITALSLLGEQLPGVATLEDLQELLGENGIVPEQAAVAARAQMPRAARPTVQAGTDADLVRRRFHDWIESGDAELPEGAIAWDLWARNLRFDDKGDAYLKVQDDGTGRLYRVDFTVSGSDVSFGDFQEVVEQDVPVAAGAVRPKPPVAVWASRPEARATTTTEEDQAMTPDQIRALRARIGATEEELPDNATPEQISAALAKPVAKTPEERDEQNPSETTGQPHEGEPVPNPATSPEGTPAESGDAPAQQPADQQPVAASSGTVTVDPETLASLQRDAAAGRAAREEQIKADREAVLRAAMGEGRFAPARLEHWRTQFAHDPDGTRTLLTASADKGGLAPGLVPVTETGGEPQAHDLADAGYPDSMLSEQEREHRDTVKAGQTTTTGGARVVTEA